MRHYRRLVWSAFVTSLAHICYGSSEIGSDAALRSLPDSPFVWSMDTINSELLAVGQRNIHRGSGGPLYLL